MRKATAYQVEAALFVHHWRQAEVHARAIKQRFGFDNAHLRHLVSNKRARTETLPSDTVKDFARHVARVRRGV